MITNYYRISSMNIYAKQCKFQLSRDVCIYRIDPMQTGYVLQFCSLVIHKEYLEMNGKCGIICFHVIVGVSTTYY